MVKINAPAEKKKEIQVKWFVGGLAGSAASISTHPLDLLKVRIQVAKSVLTKTAISSGSKTPTGLLSICKSILKNEGIPGFYKGLTASVMRQLTWSSMRFNMYYVLKKKFEERSSSGRISFFPQLLCACTSGAAGAVSGNVFDLINIRMQSNAGLPLEQRRNYRNAFDGLFKVISKEGPAACFKGLGTNIQRAIVITSAQIVTYERAKGYILSKGFEDGILAHFLSSLISGFVTVTASNPLDVMKSVIMSSTSGKSQSGFAVAKSILKQNGLLYFMKGWTPAYVRLAPHTVVTFMTLEQLKKFKIFQKN